MAFLKRLKNINIKSNIKRSVAQKHSKVMQIFRTFEPRCHRVSRVEKCVPTVFCFCLFFRLDLIVFLAWLVEHNNYSIIILVVYL